MKKEIVSLMDNTSEGFKNIELQSKNDLIGQHLAPSSQIAIQNINVSGNV